MELNKKDIKILLEALDTWESKEASTHLMSLLMGGMLSRDSESAEKLLNKTNEDYNQKEKERELKKETAILLKAKLISMKDKIESQEALTYLQNGG